MQILGYFCSFHERCERLDKTVPSGWAEEELMAKGGGSWYKMSYFKEDSRLKKRIPKLYYRKLLISSPTACFREEIPAREPHLPWCDVPGPKGVQNPEILLNVLSLRSWGKIKLESLGCWNLKGKSKGLWNSAGLNAFLNSILPSTLLSAKPCAGWTSQISGYIKATSA